MTSIRNVSKFISLCVLVGSIASAQSLVTITVGTQADGPEIASDFIGLSFETSNLLPDKHGQYIFGPENKQLIRLFQTIGIRNLRVGGGTAEDSRYQDPSHVNIDHLFAFSKAANTNVIYTVRLLNGNETNAAAVASYIERNYSPQLSCLQIGNEPDWHSYHTSPGHARDPKIVETIPDIPGSAYPSYLADWKDFAATISEAVRRVKFTGPDTGSNYPVPKAKSTDYNGESWTQRFAADEKRSGAIQFVAQHDYVGEDAKGVSVQEAIDAMLSPGWLTTNYQSLYDRVLAPVQSSGVSYRMTECNDYTGGVDGASNAFASALWALDYMHWHAAHHAVGVNFHNKRWIYTDTIYLDSAGTFQINPKAYGVKAFELGSHGRPQPLTISNPASINLTAYAVRGTQEIFVTMINKEHGAGARAAKATIISKELSGTARMLYLTAPDGDVASRAGVTLGGASIKDGLWNGTWTALTSDKTGRTEVDVPTASAVVVRLSLK